ncbi:hypothetical protein E2C01_019627 [Portunus trituberculatus]|uniref:Uncharacterized protein n=1 Tax=Portunus trituberculatus TaxID=210409 RepID=A0A5B7DZH1_PORTR|nr:hypothetical protein [Portunus trituberculatus]
MNVSSTSTLAAVVMVGLDCTQEGHLLLVYVAQAAAVPYALVSTHERCCPDARCNMNLWHPGQ